MDIVTIAYNAIDYLLCETKLTIPEICEYVGCTESDLRNYGLLTEDE